MAPIIGYSDTRVNSIDSSNKDEFGRWLYTPSQRAIKSSANVQNTDNRGRQTSFASLLKQAEQDNAVRPNVELRPANRLTTGIDILA